MEPLKIHNINLDNIVYYKTKKYKNYKIILMKYKEENKINNFVFQTSKILNLNPVDNYEKSLLLSLNNKSQGTTELSKFIKQLEEKIKTDISQNTPWLYNNDNNYNIIFQRLIRDNNCIKIKLINNSDLKTLFKLNNKNIDNIKLNNECYCKLILECYGIWINSQNNFSIYLRPIVVSFNNTEQLYDYKFASDSSSSSDNDINIIDSFTNNQNNNDIDDNNENDDNNELFINRILDSNTSE